MKTLYQCEICGTIYPVVRAAELCETMNPLLPPQIKVGDTIHFETRYDGITSDVVMAITIVPTLTPSALLSWLVEDDDRGVDLFLSRLKELNDRDARMHEYGYQVANHHQMGKDVFTDVIGEFQLRDRH